MTNIKHTPFNKVLCAVTQTVLIKHKWLEYCYVWIWTGSRDFWSLCSAGVKVAVYFTPFQHLLPNGNFWFPNHFLIGVGFLILSPVCPCSILPVDVRKRQQRWSTAVKASQETVHRGGQLLFNTTERFWDEPPFFILRNAYQLKRKDWVAENQETVPGLPAKSAGHPAPRETNRWGNQGQV